MEHREVLLKSLTCMSLDLCNRIHILGGIQQATGLYERFAIDGMIRTSRGRSHIPEFLASCVVVESHAMGMPRAAKGCGTYLRNVRAEAELHVDVGE